VGVSLEGPATDFAMLARSFNLYGEGPVLDPKTSLRPGAGAKVVREEGRLALIDTVTQPRRALSLAHAPSWAFAAQCERATRRGARRVSQVGGLCTCLGVDQEMHMSKS